MKRPRQGFAFTVLDLGCLELRAVQKATWSHRIPIEFSHEVATSKNWGLYRGYIGYILGLHRDYRVYRGYIRFIGYILGLH